MLTASACGLHHWYLVSFSVWLPLLNVLLLALAQQINLMNSMQLSTVLHGVLQSCSFAVAECRELSAYVELCRAAGKCLWKKLVPVAGGWMSQLPRLLNQLSATLTTMAALAKPDCVSLRCFVAHAGLSSIDTKLCYTV